MATCIGNSSSPKNSKRSESYRLKIQSNFYSERELDLIKKYHTVVALNKQTCKIKAFGIFFLEFFLIFVDNLCIIYSLRNENVRIIAYILPLCGTLCEPQYCFIAPFKNTCASTVFILLLANIFFYIKHNNFKAY